MNILYSTVYLICYVISLLPFWALYRISDIFTFYSTIFLNTREKSFVTIFVYLFLIRISTKFLL